MGRPFYFARLVWCSAPSGIKLIDRPVFQPFTATLSDLFGRRPIILASIGFFLAGSLGAGLAQSFTTILMGRCLQGVGGGGIAVLAEVVVTDLVPLRRRGNYYGVLSAMYSLGSVLGPILGGGFSENVTWVSLPIPRPS